MLEISKYKKEYDAVISGITDAVGERLVIFCESDMCKDMSKGTVLITVTETELTVTEGQVVLAGEKKIFGRGALVRGYEKRDARAYTLSDLCELKLEEMLSSVRLMGKYKGETVVLALGTFASRGDLRLLLKYLEQYKKNGEVNPEEEDFAAELFCPKCGQRYPDPVRKICPKCIDKVAIIKKFWIFMKKYRSRIFLIIGAYLLVSIMGAIAPYFSSAFFYDRVLLNPDDKFYGQVLLVVAIVATVNLASIFVNMFGNLVTAKMAGRFICDLKITIFESMKKLSMDFFTGRQTGGLMTQINNDANSIYWFFVDGLSYYAVSIVQIVAAAVIMFAMNPILAILCVAVLPLFFYVTGRVIKRENYYHARSHNANRRMNSRLTDSFGALRVIKAFAKEKDESRRFRTAAEGAADASRTLTIFNNTAMPALRTLMYLSNIIIWCVGGWFAITGKITYGFLTAFIAYAALLNNPMYSLVDMIDFFSACVNAMQRLFEIYEAAPSVKEAKEPVILPEVRGDIEFKNVTFSYEKSRKIIDDVSFKISAGQQIGIVGHSGAGKSTIANLLIRLYDVDGGEILIDGVNVKDLSFKQLRDNVCIVSQETYLFEGTIYENIAYAKPDAAKADVIAAAKLAGAHEFIIKLIEGYQTKIGVGNKELSGGERQRISIARAILKNPRILILDEATAAMDTRTERAIQEAIDSLSEGRTTIMIAHRLSTLRNADNLIVIEKGKVEESGTHRELMAKDGIFRKLYNMQLEAMRNVVGEE